MQSNFGTIDSFEKSRSGVRMNFWTSGERPMPRLEWSSQWVGLRTTGLNLAAAGVETDQRHQVRVDAYPRSTTIPRDVDAIESCETPSHWGRFVPSCPCTEH